MKKQEILEEIDLTKNRILQKLARLGVSVTYDENKNYHCRIYNELLGNYYKSFYGVYSSEIKKEYNLASDKSMNSLMPPTHLEYKLRFLEKVEKYLSQIKYLDTNDEITGFTFLGTHKGKRLKEEFKAKNKTIPITDLRRYNSLDKLQQLVEESIQKSKKLNNLDINISTLKMQLMKQLPNNFNNQKAYGAILGLFYEGFYGTNNSSFINSLRFKGYSTSCTTIVDFMDNKHLIYNFVALNYITRYAEKYNEKEYVAFRDKIVAVTEVLKKAFIEQHKITPGDDLIQVAIKSGKVKEKVTDNNDYPEQLCFFGADIKEARRREY